MLRDVDADSSYFEYSSIVCLQPSLGTVEGLGLGNTTFHHGSSNRGGKLLEHSQMKNLEIYQ